MENMIEKIVNAKNVTVKWRDRVRDVVLKIEDLMQENGIKSVKNGKYFLHSMKSQTHGNDMSLYVYVDDAFVRLCSKQISASRESFFLYSDFNMCYSAPCLDDLKDFVADLDDILSDIYAQIPNGDDFALCSAERKLGV